MKHRLSQRITQSMNRLRKAPAVSMKELEIYGAVTLGGLIFLFIVIRWLFD